MRTSVFACLVSVAFLAWPADAHAQRRPPIRIDRVQVGFPVNPQQGEFKPGAWMPVYIDVTAGPEGLARGELLIETSDCDDVRNNFHVPLPPLEPNEPITLMGYTKPSSLHTEV